MAAVGSPMLSRQKQASYGSVSMNSRCVRTFRQRFEEVHVLLNGLQVQGVLLGQLKSLLPGPQNSSEVECRVLKGAVTGILASRKG